MSAIGCCRAVGGDGGRLHVEEAQVRNPTNGRQDKSADIGRAHVVGWVRFFGISAHHACWRFRHKPQRFQRSERRRIHYPKCVQL